MAKTDLKIEVDVINIEEVKDKCAYLEASINELRQILEKSPQVKRLIEKLLQS